MFFGDDIKQFFFSTLAHFKVEDKNGNLIGRPGDALLTKDMNIDSLILFSGLLEGKMGGLGMHKNTAPIIPVSAIESINREERKIILNLGEEELKLTDENFKTPEGLIQYTLLKKLPVYEKYNEKIGRVVDIFFKENGKYALLVGGSGLEDFLEKLHVIPDKDLIVPGSSIIEISDKVQIALGKLDLITTLFENSVVTYDCLGESRVAFLSKAINVQQYIIK